MPSQNDARPPGTGAVPDYPSERSFVVQLRSDADPARGVVCGRVEHVVSSRAALFGSLHELARFLSEATRES